MNSKPNVFPVLCLVAALFLGIAAPRVTRAQGAVIADSVSDFSGVQGQGGWFYGFYTGAQNPSGFAQYPTFSAARGAWERNPSAWASQNPGYFSTTTAFGGHPHAIAGGIVEVNSAVKRWISPIARRVRLEGSFRKTSNFFNGPQDGIIGRVFVDGTQVFSVDIPPTDVASRTFSIPVCLNAGSTVDIAVDPKTNEFSDGAEFAVQIWNAGPVIVDGPLNTMSCPGGITAFGVNVDAPAGSMVSYQWQIQPHGGGQWQNLSSQPLVIDCPAGSGATAGEATAGQATTSTLLVRVRPCRGGTINPAAPTQYGIRCIVSDGCTSVTSSEVTFTVCPADFTCSGEVSVQDVFDFLAAWFASDTRADINLSGSVSVQDIFDFLSAWFAGC